jgi:hypothetical protein
MKRMILAIPLLLASLAFINAPAANRMTGNLTGEEAVVEFTELVKLQGVLLRGQYLIYHDDEMMEAGKPCLRRPVADHRLQSLHRARDQYDHRDAEPEGGGGRGAVAALPLPSGTGRTWREPAPTRLARAEDSYRAFSLPGEPLQDAHQEQAGRSQAFVGRGAEGRAKALAYV